jgi:hypothetical protein
VAAANPAFVEFNRKTRQFWDEQNALMKQRMADRDILDIAAKAIAFEAIRGVPVRNQMSFEKALQDPAEAKQQFLRQQARSGGKAPKADTLRRIIIDIVQQNPEIAIGKLLEELRQRQGDGIIDEIDATHIHFREAGTFAIRKSGEAVEKRVISVSIPISGLKHRLMRVKQKVSKENRSR